MSNIFNVFTDQEEGFPRLEVCCSNYIQAQSYRHFLAEALWHTWHSDRSTSMFDLDLNEFLIQTWELI